MFAFLSISVAARCFIADCLHSILSYQASRSTGSCIAIQSYRHKHVCGSHDSTDSNARSARAVLHYLIYAVGCMLTALQMSSWLNAINNSRDARALLPQSVAFSDSCSHPQASYIQCLRVPISEGTCLDFVT